MNRSEANFSNQTHQLMVTVSRHFYISKKGILTYQEKPVDVTLKNYQKAKKELLVYYLVIDRFSGNYFFQVATTGQLFPLADFLHYAWHQDKKEDHFWGLPENIAIPKAITSPALFMGLKKIGVNPFNPTAGFPSGGHVIKNLEETLWSQVIYRSTLHFRASIERLKAYIYDITLGLRPHSDLRVIWQSNLRPGYTKAPVKYREFINAFHTEESDCSKLPIALTDTATDKAADIPPSTALPYYFTAPLEELRFSESKLSEANLINDEAWEEGDTVRGIRFAYQALDLSPFCADALNYLSLYSKYYEEKYLLSKRAVLVGKAALGDLFIKKNTGSFWVMLETRPYMRALLGLADCYWERREFEQAAEIYREMLKLNPSDNQGVRYALAYTLLLLDCKEELEGFFKEHGEEESCFMLYSKALYLYRLGSAEADKTLQRAIASNEHVYGYLSGEEFMPYREPDRYSWGEPSEAICYVLDNKEVWVNSPGAIEWLKGGLKTFKEKTLVSNGNTIKQVLQTFLDEQEARLSNSTFGKYENVIELLQASFERYSHTYLDKDEKELYELHYNKQYYEAVDNNDDEEERVFCNLFGPDKIASGVVEYLSYFLPHKVIGSKDLLKTSATVIKKLGQWLFDKGFIDDGDLEIITEEAVKAGRELPAINNFEEALVKYMYEIDDEIDWDEDDELEDVFEVVAVKPGILVLETYNTEGKIEIEVKVPLKLSKLCRVGWQLNLLLVKKRKSWTIVEAGRVSY